MRDKPLAGSDQRGPKGRGLPANHPRSVGHWVGEAAVVHRGGSRLGGTTAVCSVRTLQLRDGILYSNFLGTDGQVHWKQLLVPRSLIASLRAFLLQHLHGRPHGCQEDAGQGDEDGLLEGKESRRGDIL